MVSHLKGLATGREKQIYSQTFAKVFWVLEYTALVYFSSCLHFTPSCSFHCLATPYPILTPLSLPTLSNNSEFR